MAPGRKPSIRMSVFAVNSLRRSWPSGDPRFRVIDFLFREWTFHHNETPLANGPQLRSGSPVPGRSILTTSAPKSASRLLAVPPATIIDKSRTFRPDSGPCAVVNIFSRVLRQLWCLNTGYQWYQAAKTRKRWKQRALELQDSVCNLAGVSAIIWDDSVADCRGLCLYVAIYGIDGRRC